MFFVYMYSEEFYQKRFLIGVYKNKDEAVMRQYGYLGICATPMVSPDAVGGFVDRGENKYWTVTYIREYEEGEQMTEIL